MKLPQLLLAIIFIASSLQAEARTFEMLFNVNVDQKLLGSLQPFYPDTENIWHYQGVEIGENGPHWNNSDNFVGQEFQLKILFSDSKYYHDEYESTFITETEIEIEIETDTVSSGLIFGGTSINHSPYSQEINNAPLFASDLINPEEVSGVFGSQALPSTNRHASLGYGSTASNSANHNEEFHYFSKEVGVNYSDFKSNSSLASFETIDGLITFFNILKTENKSFSFSQGWEERHYFNTATYPEPICTVEGSFTSCYTPLPPNVDPSYTYFNGVRYQGSATIASITEVSEVPVPATAWLMGSGLIGLAAIKKRRK